MHEPAAREAATAAPLAFTCTYPATPAHVSQARRSLSQILNGSPAADDAALCLSELATNATLHSHSRDSGHFTVRAQIHAARLRVEVCDDGAPGPGLPTGTTGSTGADYSSSPS